MHLDVDVEFGIDPVFLNRSTEMVVTKVARAAVSVEVSRKGSSLESGELEPDPFLLSKQQTRQSVTRQCFHEEPQKKQMLQPNEPAGLHHRLQTAATSRS